MEPFRSNPSQNRTHLIPLASACHLQNPFSIRAQRKHGPERSMHAPHGRVSHALRMTAFGSGDTRHGVGHTDSASLPELSGRAAAAATLLPGRPSI
jgi:hypothetical protein